MDRDVGLVRETFYSSLELARMALTDLGLARPRRNARSHCSATTTKKS